MMKTLECRNELDAVLIASVASALLPNAKVVIDKYNVQVDDVAITNSDTFRLRYGKLRLKTKPNKRRQND